MSRQPPRDHPWRGTFPEDKPALISFPGFTASEVSAIRIMRWREYKWVKIAKIMDCPISKAMQVMSPKYRPIKES